MVWTMFYLGLKVVFLSKGLLVNGLKSALNSGFGCHAFKGRIGCGRVILCMPLQQNAQELKVPRIKFFFRHTSFFELC